MISEEKLCKFCKETYIPRSNNSCFCSKECSYKNGKIKLLEDQKNNPQKYIDRKKYKKEVLQRKKIAEGKTVIGITTKICIICNNEFKINTGSQKYCKKCKSKVEMYRKNKDIKKNGRKRYNDHWNKWYRKNKGYEPVKEINCIICGEIFLRQRISQKICSKKCRMKYLRIRAIERYYKDKENILNKRKNNIQFCIKNKISLRIRIAIKNQGISKSLRTTELIGCTINELKIHLEKLFKDGMTWKNYGMYGWHIDHILPCAGFNLIDIEEQKKCFHYSNLQPLWAKENLEKNNKVLI